MAKPFEQYTYDDAMAAFVALDAKLQKTLSNQKYLDGDDWQGGFGWSGPTFDKDDEIGRNLRGETQREFTSKGDLRQAARRHRRGVIGRQPTWLISSRNAPADPDENDATDQELIDEAQKILNEFWKNSRVHTTLKLYVDHFIVRGHSILRPFFVKKAAVGGEIEIPGSIEEAVKHAHLFCEKPNSGCIVWNKETLEKASLYCYSVEGLNYIEMSWIDSGGETIFKTFSQTESKDFNRQNFPTSIAKYDTAETTEKENEMRLPLGGKLLLCEMTGESMLTSSMRSQQRNINKSFTMMSHNMDIDGYRSRLLTNTMPPGEYKEISGKKVFVPDETQAMTVGAGKVQYATGIPITTKVATATETKTTTTLTTPGVHESQPIDPKVFIEAAAASKAALLEDADQGHVAVSGSIAVAADALRERREEYKMSLEDTKSDLDESVSEAFETILAIVAYIMNKPDRYADLQVTFSAILNPGPISPDDRRAAMDEGDKRYRTRESAMELIGVTDPDAMKAAIAKEDEENPPKVEPDKSEE